MDSGTVFVLVLSAFAIGFIVYLQWISVRSERKSPPSTTESDQTMAKQNEREGNASRKGTVRR